MPKIKKTTSSNVLKFSFTETLRNIDDLLVNQTASALACRISNLVKF